MSFIILNFISLGPTRCNVAHIVRYWAVAGGGSKVAMTAEGGTTAFGTDESPEQIDEKLAFAGSSVTHA